MNVTVHFETAPPLVSWQAVLTNAAWKITNYTAETLTATNEFGESKYPVRNATTWHLTVREDDADGVHVEVSVPAFAESEYARGRLLGKVDDIAADVAGRCETSQSLTVDVLGRLRENSETYSD
jgi:hypothetical protein